MRTRCGDKHKTTGTALKTGYKVIHRKADGTTEFTKVGADGEKSSFIKEPGSTAAAVHSKSGTVQRKVGYNFGEKYGGTNSKKEREDNIRAGLNHLRSEYRSTGGMSKDGTRKHIASIPEELWYSEKAEKGPDCFNTPEKIKKFVSEWNLGVSGRRR